MKQCASSDLNRWLCRSLDEEVGQAGNVATTTVKFKPNPQSRFLADEMEALQKRMLQEFAEIRAAQGKLTLVDGICEELAALNAKLSKHTVRLDQVQMKLNLSCDALG
ncbi:3-ketoacyl-CoA synthase 11 [Hordeum vulgare]|nr:3-ketoacyl-CoA synthase 11 [Hordeum vulgare]